MAKVGGSRAAVCALATGLAIAVFAPSPLALADSSTLDSTCNSSGYRSLPLGGSDAATAVAEQADGKLVVAGSSDAGGDQDFVVFRLNRDCSVDSTFGASDAASGLHLFRYDVSGNTVADGATGVAVDSAGRIIVAGWRFNTVNDDAMVIRLTSAGALDTTFGDHGLAGVDTTGNERAAAVRLDAAGNIVIAGWTDATTGAHHAGLLARFTPDGLPDFSFGTDGHAIYDLSGASSVEFAALAIGSDGYLNVTGNRESAPVVFRADSSGAPDPNFCNVGGVFTIGALGTATDLTIDGAGNLVATGYSNANTGNTNDVYLARVAPDCTSSAGSPLIDLANGGFSDDVASSIAVQPDGKYVVTGSKDHTFFAARFDPQAFALDKSFNGTGLVTTDIGTFQNDNGLAMLIQRDGRILVVGSTGGGADGTDAAVVRYQGSPLVQFGAASYTVQENAGVAKISLTRTGAAQDLVTVWVSTSNGTAQSSDYSGFTKEVGFDGGQTSRTVDVPITDDSAAEGPETVLLSLSSPGGTGDAQLGPRTTATLTIRSSDQRPDGWLKVSGGSYAGNNVYNTTGTAQTVLATAANGKKRVFYTLVQNDGNVANVFKVQGGAVSGFTVRYFQGTSSTEITRAVRAGTYSTRSLAPGGSTLVRVEVTVRTGTPGGTVAKVPVRATWSGDGSRVDVVVAKVKVL